MAPEGLFAGVRFPRSQDARAGLQRGTPQRQRRPSATSTTRSSASCQPERRKPRPRLRGTQDSAPDVPRDRRAHATTWFSPRTLRAGLRPDAHPRQFAEAPALSARIEVISSCECRAFLPRSTHPAFLASIDRECPAPNYERPLPAFPSPRAVRRRPCTVISQFSFGALR